MTTYDMVVLGVVVALLILGSKAEYEVVAHRINGGGGLVFFVCLCLSGVIVAGAALLAAVIYGPVHGIAMAGVGASGLGLWVLGLKALLRWADRRS